jgi:hypothetical protein
MKRIEAKEREREREQVWVRIEDVGKKQDKGTKLGVSVESGRSAVD